MAMWKCEDVVEEPGGPGSAFSEDRLGMSGTVAWVLDGASNVAKHRVTGDEHSDASWLVRHLDRALRDLAADTDRTLSQIVADAIARTAGEALQVWHGDPDVLP